MVAECLLPGNGKTDLYGRNGGAKQLLLTLKQIGCLGSNLLTRSFLNYPVSDMARRSCLGSERPFNKSPSPVGQIKLPRIEPFCRSARLTIMKGNRHCLHPRGERQ